MKSMLAACTVLLAVSAPAFAEGGNTAFYLTSGFTVPIGDFGDAYDPGFSFGLGLRSSISDRLDWTLEIGNDRASASDALVGACAAVGRTCDAASIKRYTAGLAYEIASESRTKISLYAGGGIYNQNLSASQAIAGVFDFDITNSESGFGLNFGLGAEWPLSSNLGLGVDLRGTGIFFSGDIGNTWYLTPAAHFSIWF